jgi:hypothetical protein
VETPKASRVTVRRQARRTRAMPLDEDALAAIVA